MITAFSTSDVNDINQVLSDEQFTRDEMYWLVIAIERYEDRLIQQDRIGEKLNFLENLKAKLNNLIQIDLVNEK